jgi:hypothetical protein
LGQFWNLAAQNFTDLEVPSKNMVGEIVAQGLVVMRAAFERIVVTRARTGSIPSSLAAM